jgi:hypothetical protein
MLLCLELEVEERGVVPQIRSRVVFEFRYRAAMSMGILWRALLAKGE